MKSIKDNFFDVNKLACFLKLKTKSLYNNKKYPLSLPKRLADKIKKNDFADPIFKQFVPTKEETKKKKDFTKSPLLEEKFKKGKILQKYKKRALLICSSFCPLHCRYCFRRNFFEKLKFSGKIDFSKEIKYLSENANLEEIILSGGDPLSLNNKTLKKLLLDLDKIKHLKRIRFHTRYTIADPLRINNEFINILKMIKKQIIFVFQINHKNELDSEILKSIKKLQKIGILTFCQSVLLKGVNDSFISLYELSNILIDNNIIPYYLHQLDKIEGASHFWVNENKGKELIKKLRKNLPGYAIFRYAKEEPFKNSKTIITC